MLQADIGSIGALELDILKNPNFLPNAPYDETLQQILSLRQHIAARKVIESWPNYHNTPLRDLHEFAHHMNVAHIWYKDESSRFGLKSFKALGGAYAVFRIAEEIIHRQGIAPSFDALSNGQFRDKLQNFTVTCATDGNHGRSVAWGASMLGFGCKIFVHERVSTGRVSAIENLGATVIRVAGNYDDSVREAARMAAQNDWSVISDTSYNGYTDIPCHVMQGYTVMVQEALEQLPFGQRPTHVLVQGGVGGLAAAVCAHMSELWSDNRPHFVVVEPYNADCLYRSAAAGKPITVDGNHETIMAGLACGEVSLAAWDILKINAGYFARLPDTVVVPVMRLLKRYAAIEAGESAVAGMAAALIALSRQDLRSTLTLTANSRLLVFGTEGATDPYLYDKLVSNSMQAGGVRA